MHVAGSRRVGPRAGRSVQALRPSAAGFRPGRGARRGRRLPVRGCSSSALPVRGHASALPASAPGVRPWRAERPRSGRARRARRGGRRPHRRGRGCAHASAGCVGGSAPRPARHGESRLSRRRRALRGVCSGRRTSLLPRARSGRARGGGRRSRRGARCSRSGRRAGRGRRRRCGSRRGRVRRRGRRRSGTGCWSRRSCGRRHGRGGRSGGRRGRRSRRGRRRGRPGSRGQEAERVEVAILVRRHAHAEMDVRHVHLRVAGRPDRADPVALRHGGAPGDRQRAEVGERHRVAVPSDDRHAEAARRDAAGERDGSGGGGDHRRAGLACDVDSPVLPARVRVGADRERAHHGAGDGPAPGERQGRGREHRDPTDSTDDEQATPHPHRSFTVLSIDNTARVARRSDVVNSDYREAR